MTYLKSRDYCLEADCDGVAPGSPCACGHRCLDDRLEEAYLKFKKSKLKDRKLAFKRVVGPMIP